MVLPLNYLRETPSQTAGPYVHIGLAPQQAGFEIFQNNFTNVLAGPKTRGERITIEGRVIDGTGTPVRDVLVEIWQANAEGRYRHPADTHTAQPVDEHFRGWGRACSDFKSGLYTFETIKPGQVTGRRGHKPMAPHINFWIVARGINIGLNTRMYFSGRGGRQCCRPGAEPDRAGGSPLHADRRAEYKGRQGDLYLRYPRAGRERDRVLRYLTPECGQVHPMNTRELGGTAADAATVSAAGVKVRRVPFDAPWAWLAAGWRDVWTVPHISLAYGAVFSLLAAALVLGLLVGGLESLILALGGGFLLIGPVAAVGLYETSRRLEQGERATLWAALTAARRAKGQLGFFGAILAFCYFVWLELASLLFMLFFGGGGGWPPASNFVPTLLFSPHGLGLLVTGTIVGGILAAIVFAISVVSVPLLMTRRLDAVSAMVVSVRAAILNWQPMALWAALIAGFMSLGLATVFVGLVVMFPLVGHATWHAFRDVVAVSD